MGSAVRDGALREAATRGPDYLQRAQHRHRGHVGVCTSPREIVRNHETTVTREELYRRVWEVPFRKLIEEYGTTYDELRRVAEALDVPRPASGYWKKHAAGVAGDPPPLPEPKPGRPLHWAIGHLDVAAADRAQRRSEYEAAVGRLRVPKSLRSPHPLVARWVVERKQGKRSMRGQSNLAPSYYPHGESDDRRHRILQAILPALERLGAKITGGRDEEPISACFPDAEVAFRLREKLKQVRRPLTREEIRRGYGTAQNYHVDLHPTGLLAFMISPFVYSGRGMWEDERDGPLEDRVTDIAVGILLARDECIASTIRAQVQHAQSQERERRRIAVAEARRRDDERWAVFLALSQRHEEAERLTRFLNRLAACELPAEQSFGDRTVAEWQEWARARIEATDPFAGDPASIYERLSRGMP